MKKLPLTKRNYEAAKDFVFEKWRERAAEEVGREEPTDLTGACKFASLFAKEIFGGRLRGNQEHQWLENSEGVIDLTDAAGVDLPAGEIYLHDPEFWMNEEHRDSMESVKPRVQRWVKEFLGSQ